MERAALGRLLGASGGGSESNTPTVIEERDPERFKEAFRRAAAGSSFVFLADPSWTGSDRLVLSSTLALPDAATFPPGTGWLMIPSGGTSGRAKFARHDQDTLAAAVRGFCQHFQVERVNSVGVLPLHHVSGFVAWMRSALSGGTHLAWDWKKLETGERPSIPARSERKTSEGWFISLVPTQLQRLLDSEEAVAWLRQFDAVFIGGGPVWPSLADAAARALLPISLGYGMTETAAMVTALLPSEFEKGNRSSGRPMPHAQVEITSVGTVRIGGDCVFRGYYPNGASTQVFSTEDLGVLDADGFLQVQGRRDALIITGGKKVDPAEVESALRMAGIFADMAVVGIPDPEWGQAVVACYPADQASPDLDKLSPALESLASFKRPRQIIPVSPWPRNAQGKLNRTELTRLARIATAP